MKRRHTFITSLLAVGFMLAACASAGKINVVTGNVAVLVVDDFGSTVKSGGTPWQKGENCAVGTNEVGSGGVSDVPPPPPYSHGELVYQVLKTALSDPSNQLTSVSSTTTTTEWTYPYNGATPKVHLEAVHTSGYKTAEIIAGLTSAVKKLAGNYKLFVVNLSFVSFPCDVGAWLAGGDKDLLASYQRLINDPAQAALKATLANYEDNGQLVLQKLSPSGLPLSQAVVTNPFLVGLRPATVAAFYNSIGTTFAKENAGLTQVVNDPAWGKFTPDPAGDGTKLTVVPVGAAGNGAWYAPDDRTTLVRRVFQFPFAPALWDTVVSVSAGTKAPEPYSNWGEVMLDGSGPSIATNTYGTSYAAPRVSARETMYLLRGGPFQCNNSKPPLKYVATPAAGAWTNEGSSAWDAKCANFTAYATA